MRKLSETDRLLAEGRDVVEIVRHLQVSEEPYHRWRNQYGQLDGAQVFDHDLYSVKCWPTPRGSIWQHEHMTARLKRPVTKIVLGACVALVVALVAWGVHSHFSESSTTRILTFRPRNMAPAIRANEQIRIRKGNYQPHRGDVIIFDAPPDERTAQTLQLISRVIGLPGEKIEARNGLVYINGHLLDEPYLPKSTRTDDLPSQVDSPDSYFMMGDNRTHSTDSRVYGVIPTASVGGQVCVCDLHAP